MMDTIPAVRISYGDYHYEVRFQDVEHGDPLKLKIVSHIYKALMDFHGTRNDQIKQSVKLKRALYALAGDRPDLIHELTSRGLL
jgi:hypothetical protein